MSTNNTNNNIRPDGTSARPTVNVDQNHLSCGICLELYKEPARLPCDHSFCRQCLVELANRNCGQLKCPGCQQQCGQRVNDLPTDVTLNAIAEAVRRESQQQENLDEFVVMAKDIIRSKVHMFNVTKRTTVGQLRQMIVARTGVNPQTITAPGPKVLFSDEKTLEFYGIVSQCNLDMLFRCVGGPDIVLGFLA